VDVSQGGCVETGGSGAELVELLPVVPLSVPVALPHPASMTAATRMTGTRIMFE
jgi:hypothetical protein